jgi:hypothetical protein
LAKIFISYKRDAELDENLAAALIESFSGKQHELSIDKNIPPGEKWAEWITRQISSSDWVFVLISSRSVQSEMVRAEIEMARRFFDGRRPRLVPIRVAYTDPFPYPLDAYLNPINWATWSGPDQTAKLIQQLYDAIAEQQVGAPTSVDRDAVLEAKPVVDGLYVTRASEAEAIKRIAGDGAVTISVMGAQLMGKTALFGKLYAVANRANKAVVLIDMKLFDGLTLRDHKTFYQTFAQWFADDLGVEQPISENWVRFGNLKGCTDYVRRVLARVDRPVVLMLDELERIVDSNMSEFFGMLRSWHEARERGFKNLSLVLAATMDLHGFTKGEQFSPFNVADPKIVLRDFKPAEVDALAASAGLAPSPGRASLYLTFGGRPGLTRRAIDLLLSGQLNAKAPLNAHALIQPDSPFIDHLRQCLLNLQALPATVRPEVERAFKGGQCDELTFARLEGAGLLGGTARAPAPRCELYRAFFELQFR